ncbi:hypothetical protein D3C73_1148750 [compost metagenome]
MLIGRSSHAVLEAGRCTTMSPRAMLPPRALKLALMPTSLACRAMLPPWATFSAWSTRMPLCAYTSIPPKAWALSQAASSPRVPALPPAAPLSITTCSTTGAGL